MSNNNQQDVKKHTKYIFVIGGVLSSLGKGLTAASLAGLLEKQDYVVKIQKFDPYLNIDSGTLSPYQHGECFVLNDGFECDLDLGHYQRFTENIEFNRQCSVTSGQIYNTVIQKERRGEFLGATVTIIPYITDEIQRRFAQYDGVADIVITEIGGTVGDIEAMPFYEAIRQFTLNHDVCLLLITLVPYIRAAQELKTKPTQNSIAQLRQIGLTPTVIGLRSEVDLDENILKKISFYSNVKQQNIIVLRDAPNIYLLPLSIHAQHMEQRVLEALNMKYNENVDISKWLKVEKYFEQKQTFKQINVGVVGKYTELNDAYKSIYESLHLTEFEQNCRINIVKINSEQVNDDTDFSKYNCQGFIIPGGYGKRGTEGMIKCIEYCRTHDVPFLGICLGMQLSCIEFMRNVIKLEDVNSQEFEDENKKCKNPVIHYMENQKNIKQMGGTNRLGAYKCKLVDPFLRQIFGKDEIMERHRHRLEFNNDYEKYMNGDFQIAGINTDHDEKLVEIVRNVKCKYFIACQFHPELASRLGNPDPLFKSFVQAILN